MVALKSNLNTIQPIIYLQGAMNRKGIKNFSRNYHLPKSDMILSFKHVTNIDSAGIGFLVKLFGHAYAKGHTIRLADAPLKIRIILELTQIDQIFEIVDNHNHQIAIAA